MSSSTTILLLRQLLRLGWGAVFLGYLLPLPSLELGGWVVLVLPWVGALVWARGRGSEPDGEALRARIWSQAFVALLVTLVLFFVIGTLAQVVALVLTLLFDQPFAGLRMLHFTVVMAAIGIATLPFRRIDAGERGAEAGASPPGAGPTASDETTG